MGDGMGDHFSELLVSLMALRAHTSRQKPLSVLFPWTSKINTNQYVTAPKAAGLKAN